MTLPPSVLAGRSHVEIDAGHASAAVDVGISACEREDLLKLDAGHADAIAGAACETCVDDPSCGGDLIEVGAAGSGQYYCADCFESKAEVIWQELIA